MSVTSNWNIKQKRLKEIIRKEDCFKEAKELFLSMHNSVHFSKVTNSKTSTIIDEVFLNINKDDCYIMPTSKDVTIAWNIWHITRIEDLTINLLVNNSNQILTDDRLKLMNIDVTDTGNAMTDDEIIKLSKNINYIELINYRNDVGVNTQNILKSLEYDDMKRKFSKQSLNRILDEKGLVNHPDSIWLLDFWGKKDVAGIILMPITRHQIVHINDCLKLKNTISKKKDFYRC